MEKLNQKTSCYSSSLLIKFATTHSFNLSKLFEGIENYETFLRNRHEWIDMSIWTRLAENFEKTGGNLFNAAVEITEQQVSNFQLLFLKAFSLPLILRNVGRYFEKTINPNIVLHVEQKSKRMIDIVFFPKNQIKFSPQICDYNRGCAFATANLKQLKNIQMVEVSCSARSDAPECRYRFTWDSEPSIFVRLKNFIFFRFTSQKDILTHIEDSHNQLQSQYDELARIKDFYGHVMQNMQEGVLWLDPGGKITFVNKGFLSIIRLSGQEEALGRDWTEFLSGAQMREIGLDLMKECHETPGTPDSFDLMFKTHDNEERLGQTTFLWVESTQQKPGYLLTIRDITDKRTIERKLFAAENRYRSL